MATKKSVKAKNIFATVDLYGNPVHCTADNWIGHIIEPVSGHPELTGREHDVKKAIQDPELIRPSTKTGKALAFERITPAETLRVIVYYNDQTVIQTGRTFGWVGTAYPDHPAYTSQVGAPIYTKPVAKPLTASPTKKEGEA